MSWLSYFFFYTYTGIVLIAGIWGAFINPYFDYKLLFHLDPYSLTEYSRINAISQYRFLRALELGYGLFSSLFVKQIFTEKTFNRLFLIIMGSGILARIFSLLFDGIPSPLFIFFLVYEFSGFIVIYSYTNKRITSVNAG